MPELEQYISQGERRLGGLRNCSLFTVYTKMPERQDVDYFGAGPAPLPTSVLEEASRALLNFKGQGIGIVEMSHRSPEATQVLEETKAALRQLLDVPDDYDVIFTQAGGSGQFSEVVYHMVAVWVERERRRCEQLWATTSFANASDDDKFTELRKAVKQNLRLDYLITGSWSLKASQEASRLVGKDHVHIITDAREANAGKFGVIPSQNTWNLERSTVLGAGSDPQPSALTYYCDNETVDGVEFQGFPTALESSDPEHDRLVVADMSSNILSRRVAVSKYAAIFAGAQKNIGTTGVAIVIIRKSLLQAPLPSSDLLRRLNLPIGPVALDWPTLAKNNSLYNTLPILDVWIAGQVMSNLLKTHGAAKVSGQETIANTKAKKIYDVLDARSDVYQVVPHQTIRSRMNICLRVMNGSAEHEDTFLKGAKALNLTGLKGHRSVGGIRISNCSYACIF